MKRFLLAMILAVLAPSGALAGCVPHDTDASHADEAYGTIEALEAAPAPWSEPAEHPRCARVRLDDGRSVEVPLLPLQHIQIGHRVRVVRSPAGVRAEPA